MQILINMQGELSMRQEHSSMGYARLADTQLNARSKEKASKKQVYNSWWLPALATRATLHISPSLQGILKQSAFVFNRVFDYASCIENCAYNLQLYLNPAINCKTICIILQTMRTEAKRSEVKQSEVHCNKFAFTCSDKSKFAWQI